MIFYKAVKPDGTDFHTGTVQWLPLEPANKPIKNRIIKHPTSKKVIVGKHSTSLAVSTNPMNVLGAYWPMRMAIVKPAVGYIPVYCSDDKWQALAWEVVREIPAYTHFGSNGVYVKSLIDQILRLTLEQTNYAYRLWSKNRNTKYSMYHISSHRHSAVSSAISYVLTTIVGNRLYITLDVVRALITRDFIDTDVYDNMTMPFRKVGIVVHPDDPEVV